MDLTRGARRYLGAALLTSLVATLASIGSVAAANPETLTVTGQSSSTITLTLADTSAGFGATMTPNGGASGGEGVLVATVAAGSCYDWASTLTVSSNVIYDVEVSSNVTNTNLDFMTADPATYAACTGGTAIIIAPGGNFDAFAAQAIPATSTVHSYYLGLDVIWLDAPSATLGNATLTITATSTI